MVTNFRVSFLDPSNPYVLICQVRIREYLLSFIYLWKSQSDRSPYCQTQRCFSGRTDPEGPNKRRKIDGSPDDIVGADSVDESIESTVTTVDSTLFVPAKGGKMHEVVKRSVVSAIVTRIDLLEYIAAGEAQD